MYDNELIKNMRRSNVTYSDALKCQLIEKGAKNYGQIKKKCSADS